MEFRSLLAIQVCFSVLCVINAVPFSLNLVENDEVEDVDAGLVESLLEIGDKLFGEPKKESGEFSKPLINNDLFLKFKMHTKYIHTNY